jgi:membrane fusion protein, heavy metal efflux system
MVAMKAKYSMSVLLVVPILWIAGCGDPGAAQDDHDHDEHEIHRLTVWDGEWEYFVQAEVHEGSGRVEGTLFLSRNHAPLEETGAGEGVGRIWLRTPGGDEGAAELMAEAPGVFPFEVFYGEATEGRLMVELDAVAEAAPVELGSLDRHAGPPLDPPGVDLRNFEKAAQWMLSVEVEPTPTRSMAHSLVVPGRTVPDEGSLVRVTAPVDGEILSPGSGLPGAGARISSGQRVAGLMPRLAGEVSWPEERMAYLQAQEAMESARRLREEDAISLRDFQSRELEYERRRAAWEAVTATAGRGGVWLEDEGDELYLLTNRSGVVRDTRIMPGMAVSRGDELLTLYDPDRMWLHVLAPPDELAELDGIHAVEVQVGRSRPVRVEEGRSDVVSRDGGGDASGTRVRWTLALNGVDGDLQPDQPVRVTLVGPAQEDALMVPTGAVFDEHSHRVVFVQHSGDQFERRVVEVGPSHGGWTMIQNGLTAGERVVTRGVYPLHLATGDIEVDHGHEH